MSSRETRGLFIVGAMLLGIALSGCVGGEGESSPSSTAESPSSAPAPSSPAPATTPDPWAGHFDDEAADAAVGEFVWQSWGSFGDPGGVAAQRNDNQTIEPGHYQVSISCAGATRVLGRIASSAGSDIAPISLECPTTTTTSVELSEPGMLIEIDSDRDPGAYLIQVSRT